MESLCDKLGIHGKFRHNVAAILALALCGCAISGLPFFRFEYYDAYMATYNLTNTQMGLFGTVIGVFGIVSYLFGGMVADGLPIRKVISGSLVITGGAGLLHLLPLDFYGLLVIYAIWGVSTTFAFAPACVKAVRAMADDDSQGKAFGFYEGAGSVAGALVAMVALAIFNWGNSHAGNDVIAMRYAIIFYSLVNIAMGALAWFIVKDDRVRLHAGKASFKGIAKVLRSPAVWMICLVAFCNHVFCLSVYYFIPYVTEVMGATVAIGATLGIVRKWGSVVGNVAGGYLADWMGTGRLMLAAYAVMLLGLIGMQLVPATSGFVVLVAVLFFFIFIFFHMNMGVSWTMLTEGGVPVEYSGTAAGVICMAGAIPATFVSVLAGRMIDSNPGAAGYQSFFGFLTVVIGIGLLVMIVWALYVKRRKTAAASLSAAQEEAYRNACGCGCHRGMPGSEDNAKDDAAECAAPLEATSCCCGEPEHSQTADAPCCCGCDDGAGRDVTTPVSVTKEVARAAMGCHCGFGLVEEKADEQESGEGK